MYIYKLPNAAASKLAVTTTATTLYSLIDTAASEAANLSGKLNAVDIFVEGGDVRILFDGNTPTATNGFLLKTGMLANFRGVPITKMQLIAVGSSSVNCSVQVGSSDDSESSSISGASANLSSTGNLTLAGFDSGADSNKTSESYPLSSHHLEETLADVTNETSATNYYYVDMDGSHSLSIQINTGGTAPTDTITITIEGSNEDNGTAQASVFYTDVTKMAYDAATNALGTASWVDVDMMAFFSASIARDFKFLRVKTVTAGGNNDQDYTIYAKKSF